MIDDAHPAHEELEEYAHISRGRSQSGSPACKSICWGAMVAARTSSKWTY